MKNLRNIALAILAVTLVSCGSDPTRELVDKLRSSYDMDGQTVELEGYIGAPTSMTVVDGIAAIGLYWNYGQGHVTTAADIRVPFGQEPNSFCIPEKFSDEDIEIYDSEGKKHDYKTKVKITGVVKYTERDWEEKMNAPYVDNPNIGSMNDMMRKRHEALKTAAEKRKEETGDPANYTFHIDVQKITLP